MNKVSITVKGTVIRPSSSLYFNCVLFTICVDNGRPEDEVRTMCKVRLCDTRPGDFIFEENHSGGYNSGVLAMLNAITKECWSVKLIELSWKMQKENLDEIEEHYQA